MDVFQFLKTSQKMQYQVTSDAVIDLGFTTISYSAQESSVFENYALIGRSLTHNQLRQIEQELIKRDRKPAVYFERTSDHKHISTLLEKQGYKLAVSDVWLFYDDYQDVPKLAIKVKHVETAPELDQFIDTFDKSFQKDDPQNPYGAQAEFLPVIRKMWERFHNDPRIKLFLAYEGHKPVATAILNSFGGIGYVMCVGTVREARRKGFGKAITRAAVRESMAAGNTHHCLTTETGTYPHKFYEHIGFKPRFVAVAYAKS